MKKEKFLKLLPLIAMALIIIFFGAAIKNISTKDILSFAPKNLVLAAFLVWGLYLLKSVSVVFPLLVLYVSVGAMFPVLPAICINTVGLLLCITLPFFIGRFSGSEVVSSLTKKYSRVGQLSQFSLQNAVFSSYFLRIINLLPGDIVSIVLGASGMPYRSYCVGSMLGLLPVMIPAVLVGQNLSNPFSVGFLVPFVVILVISLASALLYSRWQKKHREK
ncbi:MAG: VTT domain-containing protein [Hydrogenoanaerobacterium sp.]